MIGFVVVNYLCWLSQGVFYGAIKKKDCRCEYLMRHVNPSHFMTVVWSSNVVNK